MAAGLSYRRSRIRIRGWTPTVSLALHQHARGCMSGDMPHRRVRTDIAARHLASLPPRWHVDYLRPNARRCRGRVHAHRQRTSGTLSVACTQDWRGSALSVYPQHLVKTGGALGSRALCTRSELQESARVATDHAFSRLEHFQPTAMPALYPPRVTRPQLDETHVLTDLRGAWGV